MEHVHKQTISFRGDRTMRNKEVLVGYEGDNLVERLEFVLPELVGGQVAKLMITGADAITLNRTDDGRYAADLTREMIGPDGRRDAYVRIDGVSGQIWQSAPLRIVTGKLPDVEEEIEKTYPTAVGQMLTAMAEHTGEMEAQEQRVERAAQKAEEAAERAESGGGSGGPGEDGGYYQPTVTDGVLTWTPSKGDMPGVPESDIRGPKGEAGRDGEDGKSAYQYAQDGGYTGTEAEFAQKMAQELPEPYTLPVATADRLGGVMIGGGLQVDEDGRASVEPVGKFELIDRVVVGCELLAEKPDDWETNYGDYYAWQDASLLKCPNADAWRDGVIYKAVDFEPFAILLLNKEPDGTPYNFSKFVAIEYIPTATGFAAGGSGSINYSWGNNCVLPLPHLSATNTQWCAIEARIENGIVMAKGSHTTVKWSNMYERHPFSYRMMKYADALTEFKAQCAAQGITYSRGTAFEIWGVRSK